MIDDSTTLQEFDRLDYYAVDSITTHLCPRTIPNNYFPTLLSSLSFRVRRSSSTAQKVSDQLLAHRFVNAIIKSAHAGIDPEVS